MNSKSIYSAVEAYKHQPSCNKDQYEQSYNESLIDNDNFWNFQAQRLEWSKPWTKTSQWSYTDDVNIQWYLGGKLNVSFNCIDRHLDKNANKVAFHWVADDPNQPGKDICYQELHDRVCQLSNALIEMGVKKGDRVTLYLPMIPEAVYSMLACSRIGAIHSVVFAGFSPDSLAGRICDCESDFVITADEGIRGGKLSQLKENVDAALKITDRVKKVLVVKRTGTKIPWSPERDHWYSQLVDKQPKFFSPVEMDSEDPLFVLYTSGSTGKPKGVLHTTGGYLVYASLTHKYVFDHKPEDVYWCTADVGWITGHSYIVYGPLSNAATSILFEGTPTYPDCSRHWQIVDKYKVTSYYTAPTAIRAMMQKGDYYLENSKRTSLKLLGSVGEPINPEAWRWYHEKVGHKNCPIVDTWWQTETGGIMITPLPGATDLKPGSASLAFFGIEPALLDDQGKEIGDISASGVLVMKRSWPGQMRTIYGDHERFKKTYFSQYPGYYFAGDGCTRDEDSYYWITGRVDDVINVSGHRLGTAEIESSLVAHQLVAEAAVVASDHKIKGQAIFAFVILNDGTAPSEKLSEELRAWVAKDIGAIARPEAVHITDALPKTRSGKIMRRILKQLTAGKTTDLGDLSTLADPDCLNTLIEQTEKLI